MLTFIKGGSLIDSNANNSAASGGRQSQSITKVINMWQKIKDEPPPKRGPHQKVPDEVVVDYFNSGATYREIENLTGLSQMQISRIKKRNIEKITPKLQVNFEQIVQIIEKYRPGTKNSSIQNKIDAMIEEVKKL